MDGRRTPAFRLVALVFIAGVLAGCVRHERGPGPLLEVEQLGVSLNIPAGWKIDPDNPWVFRKDEGVGRVLYEPLSGREFGSCVEAMVLADGGEVVSRREISAGMRSGVEVVARDDSRGMMAIRLFVLKQDIVIEVSIEVPEKQFARQEKLLRESLATVSISG